MMALTKQQKIYMGILALAAGAWSVDRYILGGAGTAPQGASAESAARDRATARTGNPLTPATKPSLCARFTDFAQKIPTLEAAPDAFVPPAYWLRGEIRPQSPRVPGVTPGGVLDVEQFRKGYKLTAIFRAGRGDAAVINGVLVQVGQQFGTNGVIHLESLTAKSATLSVSGTPVVLQLEPGK